MIDDKLHYAEGYRYQVTKDCRIQTDILGYSIDRPFYSLTPDGVVTAKTGYAWDGASGKLTIQTDSNKRSSLIHDILYQMMRAGELPHACFHPANEELRKISIRDGMFKFRANYYFAAVERFGSAFAAVQPEKEYVCGPV
jgi:hypothetical protein